MEGLVGVLLGLVTLSHAYPAYPQDDQDYLQMISRLVAEKRGLLDRSYDDYYPSERQYPYEGNARGYPPEIQELKEWEMRQGKGYGPSAELLEENDFFDGKLRVVNNWPIRDLKLGQIGGVAVCPEGYPHVFHRGDRSWGKDFFEPSTHTYTKKGDGPIKEPTVLRLNGTNGVVLDKWGEDLFYMPHGLTIDKDNNFWMTDVALHQVFKFISGDKKPSLVLGKAFDPAKANNDTDRFCEPTDVAVASNGDFFVADGYCNNRVVKYNKDGDRLGQFGEDDLNLPHGLALIESENVICVADRENYRVICYDAGMEDNDSSGQNSLGEYIVEYDIRGNVYAIEYSPVDGMLYGLAWGEMEFGFTIDVTENPVYSEDLIATWSPNGKGFEAPHDLSVSPDGNSVYVGEVHTLRGEKADDSDNDVQDAETMDLDDGPRSNIWKMVKAGEDGEEEEEELEDLTHEEGDDDEEEEDEDEEGEEEEEGEE